MCDNKESECKGYINQGHHRGRRIATIKKADTEAIQIKRTAKGGEGRQKRQRKQTLYKSRVPHREEKSDNKESEYKGYTNQGCRRGEEKGDNKESGYECYINQGNRRGRRRATKKRANTEAIQVKGTAEGGRQ